MRRYNIHGSAGQLPRVLAAARGGIFQPWNTPNFAQSFFFLLLPQGLLHVPLLELNTTSSCWMGCTPRAPTGWGCRPRTAADGVVRHELLLVGLGLYTARLGLYAT